MVGSKSKQITIYISLILIMILSACDKYVNTYSFANNQGEEILRCFNEGDKEKFKSMFSKRQRERKELDSEIDEAMKFIDGKIISHYPSCFGGDSDAIDDGEVTYINVSLNIDDIKTDTGKKYTLSGLYYIKNKKDPNNIGLIVVTIYEEQVENDTDYSDNPQVTIGKYGY